jgi:hypothetical protein
MEPALSATADIWRHRIIESGNVRLRMGVPLGVDGQKII